MSISRRHVPEFPDNHLSLIFTNPDIKIQDTRILIYHSSHQQTFFKLRETQITTTTMCFISYFRRSAQYDKNHQDASPLPRTPRTSQEQREHTAKKAQDRKEWIQAAKAREKQEKKEKSLTKHEKRQRQRIQRVSLPLITTMDLIFSVHPA